MNMWEVLSTITTKSVRAGEYAAPPAHGPMISEICGITPEARTFMRKMSANIAREATPSWMRAPPPSLMPITGQPLRSANFCTLTIFSPLTWDREPPKTPKSWEYTATRRPSTVP